MEMFNKDHFKNATLKGARYPIILLKLPLEQVIA